jgi:hypothetical protein
MTVHICNTFFAFDDFLPVSTILVYVYESVILMIRVHTYRETRVSIGRLMKKGWFFRNSKNISLTHFSLRVLIVTAESNIIRFLTKDLFSADFSLRGYFIIVLGKFIFHPCFVRSCEVKEFKTEWICKITLD